MSVDFCLPNALLLGRKSFARGPKDATEAFLVHSSISQAGLYRHGLSSPGAITGACLHTDVQVLWVQLSWPQFG